MIVRRHAPDTFYYVCTHRSHPAVWSIIELLLAFRGLYIIIRKLPCYLLLLDVLYEQEKFLQVFLSHASPKEILVWSFSGIFFVDV